VTKNLYHALRAILKARHDAVNGVAKPLRVWVDAICINQNGDQEKSKQLLYMRQIYAQAEEVVAWVGPTEKRRLSSRTAKSLQDLLIRERGGHLTDKQLEAAGLFFSEPYWERVWIIQEITVASKLTVIYGDCQFQWDDIVAILSLLKYTEANLKTVKYTTFLETTHLLEFRDKYVGPGIGLLPAMVWSRLALATQPKDKIFACLECVMTAPDSSDVLVTSNPSR
jgi:hypothetical protein